MYVTTTSGLRVFDWNTQKRIKTILDGDKYEESIILWNSKYLLTNTHNANTINVYNLKKTKKKKALS